MSRAAARATAPVLAALSRLEHMADDQQRAIRGALLDELLSGRADGEIAARVASCGVDFGATPFSVVLGSAPADADALPAPNLVSDRIALVPDRPGLADVIAEVSAGTGRHRPRRQRRRGRAALAARRRARAAPGDGRASAASSAFEDFDLATLAVTEAPRSGCGRRSTSCSTCSTRTRRCSRR